MTCSPTGHYYPQGSHTSGAVPTYRSFQFAESLEGTKASMARNKQRSPSVPAYMPTSSNYESMTSMQQQGQSRGMVRLEELDHEEPARYRQPTDSELERSQTIPEDIVRTAREAGAAGDESNDASKGRRS